MEIKGEVEGGGLVFIFFFLVAASFRKAQETIIHKVLFQDVKKP
jgi:hypothetical protein